MQADTHVTKHRFAPRSWLQGNTRRKENKRQYEKKKKEIIPIQNKGQTMKTKIKQEIKEKYIGRHHKMEASVLF